MSANFLDDLDAVDPGAVESTGPNYPVAQWLHGDPKLASAGGVAHTGGVILPAKYLDDNLAPPPGWTRANIAFSSGKSETVLAAQKPRLAVVRTRFRWFVVYNGVTTYYPRSDYIANSGMRGHVQALCGVHGFDFPVVLTFKGKASQEFERLLRDFSQKVQDAAHRLLQAKPIPGGPSGPPPKPPQQRFPRFAFYMRLSPGLHVKAGQKGQESIITPPVLELPNALTEDYLGKTYVGRERLVAFQQIFHDAAEWAAAWDRPGAEETDARDEVDPETGEYVPATKTGSSGSAHPSAPAREKPDSEIWEEFCNEHEIERTDLVRAVKFNTPSAYLKAHPEDNLEGLMAKIMAARQAPPSRTGLPFD